MCPIEHDKSDNQMSAQLQWPYIARFKLCALLRNGTVDSSASQRSHSCQLLVCEAPISSPVFFPLCL